MAFTGVISNASDSTFLGSVRGASSLGVMGVLEFVAAPVSLGLAYDLASGSQVWKFAMVAGRSRRAGSEATVTPRFSCNLSVG